MHRDRTILRCTALLLTSLVLAGCGGGPGGSATPTLQPQAFDDPPEVRLGERLFLETRFAEFFAVNSPASVNAALTAGDPALATLPTADGSALVGPFRGQSMNCRQCHLVDEAFGQRGGGNRTYADFARRSVVTERGDGPALTVRNSPKLVESTLPRATDLILHFDGEFTSAQALAAATLTGRNTGWLSTEHAQAVAHIARVIREDDGTGALAADAGGAYRTVLSGSSASLVLPSGFRIDVGTASDEQILAAVARLIAAYVDSLRFARNGQGLDVGSPFDLFLARNALPATPDFGESDLDYARRLRGQLDALRTPSFVPANSLRQFQFHPEQAFQFSDAELRGLRVFLREPASAAGLSADEQANGGVGNCVSCHAPPAFTDFSLHNTGISQLEYDGVHAAGAFAALAVPSLAARNDPAVAQASLPSTPEHPDYESRMRSIPEAGDAQRVDLGAWNVFANGDFPLSQTPLRNLLCAIVPGSDCASLSDDILLARAVGAFKTPSLRDLADSNPYMHDGGFDTLEDGIAVYATTAAMARAGTLRNADPRLANIAINAQDQADLAAFLRALNEDYN